MIQGFFSSPYFYVKIILKVGVTMIHVGTIGTGLIVDNFLSAVKDNEGMICQAVYSRSLEKAKSFANKHNVTLYYENLDAFLNDETIQVVYIASPNSLHYEHAKKSLLANKHVICEKPFTSTMKECEELINLAKEKHLLLFEAITTIHLPHVQIIKDLLSHLGTLRMVQCNFSQYSSKYDDYLKGKNPNVFTLTYSGGALSDINIYNLHLITYLFGEPNDIQYFANIGRTNVDTSGILILTYDTFLCSCIACKDSRSDNILQFQGEKGFIKVNSQPSRMMNVHMYTNEDEKHIEIQDNDNALYYEVKDFITLINNNDYTKTYQLLDHTLLVMKLYEEARKKANIYFEVDKQ